MADNFEILSVLPSVQIVTPTTTEDIYRVWIRSLPSGTVFPMSLILTQVDPVYIGSVATEQAKVIEQYAATPGVTGIVVIEEVNGAGQLDDIQVVTVASTSGRSEDELRSRLLLTPVATFRAQVAAKRDNLDAIEGL